MTEQCVRSGCDLPVVEDGAWTAGEKPVTCAVHRRRERLRDGLCPGCATPLDVIPIMNDLTGRPRTSGGVPLTRRACPGCGYALAIQHRPQGGKR